jgi:putative DeoR family transcriptional regulator (stage III sporulation protein D)
MGRFFMQDKLFLDLGGERAVAMGRYVAETGATVRQAAAVFGVSKSTAHKDLVTKLKYENYYLYCRVEKILQKNKRERHIRGGIATKEKYMRSTKK